MSVATVSTIDDIFRDIDQQTRAYEITSPEDKRERYLFFGGDVGDVAYSGGMRVDSPSIPRKTLYRCLVTPCVTVRKMELLALIPAGGVIPGSADRIKEGCGEYWLNAGPEAMSLLNQYGNPGDPGRNLGLVELAPHLLCGRDWEREVKPLDFTRTFFPAWPTLPKLDSDLIVEFLQRFEYVKTTAEPRIANQRELYVTVGQDMLRALEAAARWHEHICTKTNHAVAQPRGEESYKRDFDPLDNVCFERSGAVRNTDALRRVAEAMKTGTNNGLSGDQLEKILETVVPKAPAISAEALAAAIATALPLALKMMQDQPPIEVKADTATPKVAAKPAKNNDNAKQ